MEFVETLGSVWASTVDKWSDEDEIILPIIGGWIVGFSTYLLYGGLLLIIDVTRSPDWVYSKKHQKKRDYSLQKTSFNPAFTDLVKNVLFNWLVVIPLGLYFMQKVLRPIGLGVYVSRELPTLRELIFQAVASPFMVDLLFFSSHYMLHTKPFYASVHKKHHDFKAPHALACIYAHPFEALVGNTFAVMGVAFLLRAHCLIWWVGLVAGWMSTCNGHSGYDLPWASRRSNGFSDFHDHHHEFFVGNYGSIGLMDWIFGTDKKWRERCDQIIAARKKLA